MNFRNCVEKAQQQKSIKIINDKINPHLEVAKEIAKVEPNPILFKNVMCYISLRYKRLHVNKGVKKFILDKLVRSGIPLFTYIFILNPFLSYMVILFLFIS